MSVTDLDERMDAANYRVRHTLQTLKRYRHLSDAAIAQRLDMSRAKVNSYIAGPTKVTTEMLAAFAWVLEVPDHRGPLSTTCSTRSSTSTVWFASST